MIDNRRQNSKSIGQDFPLLDYIDHGKRSRDENYLAILGSNAERQQTILRCIIDAGNYGITVDEISERLGVPPNAISGRVTALKKAGLCRHTELRRRTRSGCSASVLVACEVKP